MRERGYLEAQAGNARERNREDGQSGEHQSQQGLRRRHHPVYEVLEGALRLDYVTWTKPATL